jgi:sugar phosphate isomerase/epimerase
MEIAISSIAYLGKPVESFVESCIKNDFIPEFSSGMPYKENMPEIFLAAKTRKKFAHNYFPAPEIPFVLNLASNNKEIRKKSIMHCVQGMQLSEKAGTTFYSAHSGFCVDPDPAELGRQLVRSANIDRELHYRIFIDSLQEVLKLSTSTGLNFLIENNVLAKMNRYDDGINPLLCVESYECKRTIKDCNDKRLGLLVDTAHVKVSAITLGFSPFVFFNELQEFIHCIHHSDNEGEFDNNMKLKKDYWFLDLIKNFKHIAHVIEVKKITEEEIKEQMELLLHFID